MARVILHITLGFREVGVANLGKMRAEHFSVKFLLIDPNGMKWSESLQGVARRNEMTTQSFDFSFQVGGGRWDDQCIGEISPLFVSFF